MDPLCVLGGACSGVQLANMLSGGGQEGGRRAGTENVLLVAGLGKAAEIAR
jgi:cysteine desulfurase